MTLPFARATAASSRLAAVFVSLALIACVPSPPTADSAGDRMLYRFEGSTMGTYFVVQVVGPSDQPLDEAARAQLAATIEGQLERVNQLMSTWLEDSELSRFNRWSSTEPFELSEETLEVMRAAIDIGEATAGALDVTIGPLVDAWGFGPTATAPTMPSDETIDALMARTGLNHLALDPSAPTAISKRLPDLRVELSSLAKGYAVDRVTEALLAAGHSDHLVEVGGEVRTAGYNLEGRPWRMAVERPTAELGSIQLVVPLSGQAMATSGDYRSYREVDGERLSHLLDPRTGRPIGHKLASVSVVDATCLQADGLSTALMIMGPDEGFTWAEDQDIAALFLVRTGDGAFAEKATSAFERLATGSDENALGPPKG